VKPSSGELRFGEIYESHVDFVWRSARRLGVPESMVDDVVQQVFLTVHRKLVEFEGRSSLKTWMFAIVLRTVRDHRRGVRRKSPHWQAEPADPDLIADDGRGPHEALVRAEAWRVVDELLESLEGDKRVVFVLAELEQMTAQEISEATGLPPKAVYSRLRAARTDFERAAARMRRRLGREA
jgi:RNA polymerase sigma-70 factor (ECF subfamily)